MLNTLIYDLYDYDPKDHSYVIKISPDYYLDIFNKLDHYPIRKRDINQSVINYIEDCSEDIPLSKTIKIEIKIKKEPRNADLEERTAKGVRNYFQYILASYKKMSKTVLNTSLIYMLIFAIIAVATFFIESLQLNINRIFLKMILEGVSIGSWVFLWEAIAGLVIKNRENRFLIKTYKRLSKSFLYFTYD